MKRTLLASLAVALLASTSAFAQAPAGAPAGSTGACKDGSFTSNATKKGACAGHKGVKDWFAADAAPAAAASSAVVPATPVVPASPAAPVAAAPAKSAAPTAAPTTAPTATKAAATPAAGGGPGLVWVNSGSKVYHCAGSKYYGTTKAGSYMSEAAAKTAGNHADHGKACA